MVTINPTVIGRPVEIMGYTTYSKTGIFQTEAQKGRFHTFGIGYEALIGGHAGQYTTVIVELDNGHLRSVALDQVKFLDRV
jgi:hypothetical protein